MGDFIKFERINEKLKKNIILHTYNISNFSY
jgi:hypothetical protein